MDIATHTRTVSEDVGMLAVMDALAEDQRISQRELAQRTGLNLKKVNYCLRKLAERGHVKFQRVARSPHKRSYLYILTPAGLREKSALAYRFVRLSLRFYDEVAARWGQCLREMATAGVRRVVLYGATDAARIVLDQMQDLESGPLEVVGVVDRAIAGGTVATTMVAGAATAGATERVEEGEPEAAVAAAVEDAVQDARTAQSRDARKSSARESSGSEDPAANPNSTPEAPQRTAARLFCGIPVLGTAEPAARIGDAARVGDAVLITVLDGVEEVEKELLAAGWAAASIWRVH